MNLSKECVTAAKLSRNVYADPDVTEAFNFMIKHLKRWDKAVPLALKSRKASMALVSVLDKRTQSLLAEAKTLNKNVDRLAGEFNKGNDMKNAKNAKDQAKKLYDEIKKTEVFSSKSQKAGYIIGQCEKQWNALAKLKMPDSISKEVLKHQSHILTSFKQLRATENMLGKARLDLAENLAHLRDVELNFRALHKDVKNSLRFVLAKSPDLKQEADRLNKNLGVIQDSMRALSV